MPWQPLRTPWHHSRDFSWTNTAHIFLFHIFHTNQQTSKQTNTSHAAASALTHINMLYRQAGFLLMRCKNKPCCVQIFISWVNDAVLNRTLGRRRQEQVWRPTRFSHLPRRVRAINSLLHTHTPTSYTASANAWPFSSQSETSLIFRVYIKNWPFPGCHPRGYRTSLLYVSHTPLNSERETSNTPDGDTFLTEKSEKYDITIFF